MKVIETVIQWSSLSKDEKRNLREKIRRIIERQGPISFDDIKRRIRIEHQHLISSPIQLLVGSNAVHRNDRGLYVIDEPADVESLTFVPFEGSKLLRVHGKPCDEPTNYGPGSEGKIAVLSARYHSGIPLWNKRDNSVCSVLREGAGFHKKNWQPADEVYL